MKKLIPILFLLVACKAANHDGKYINHTNGQFSVTDDTLEVRDTVIIEHTGFQKIRNGVTQPKEFKTKQLFELHPQFNGNQLILNNNTYEKL
ncbi:MAG TPA: hypothetical protein VIM55_10095 [Mucilaginibacter sp.]